MGLNIEEKLRKIFIIHMRYVSLLNRELIKWDEGTLPEKKDKKIQQENQPKGNSEKKKNA